MADECEIVWTDLALDDLQKTVEYLELNFTVKEKERLGDEIEKNFIDCKV